ncbi:MAG: UDP-N-acetylmuramate dehydrogenase [Candidatus Margulisiibacteriota bacterium]
MRQEGLTVLSDEQMSKHTTFKIGGPAELLIIPSCREDLKAALKILKQACVPFFTIGRGSNSLVCDRGIKGAVIKLGDDFGTIKIEGEKIFCGAGVGLSRLINKCAERGLCGIENLAGIPSSVGGAVFMNASSFGSSFGDVVEQVRTFDLSGTEYSYEKRDCGFGYRTSVFQSNHQIIFEVALALKKDEPKEIKSRIASILSKKISAQPLKDESAGCIFKNPPGKNAGELIEKAGLKGLVLGGAKISRTHANYIINTGGAKAADVLGLIEKIRSVVKEKFEVELELEIGIVGF